MVLRFVQRCPNQRRTRTAATSQMDHFVITVNGSKPLTIITKRSILDVAAVLDPPLQIIGNVSEDMSFFLSIHMVY